jgi:flavin reductase (DIM6/NTAB) family NADH-FMN oxidoreductase RutF
MQRPWNLVPQPVYSLSTLDKDGNPNMNICTYVVPISMKPKRYYLGVYKNTKTLENVENTDEYLLQILSESDIKLVKRFGKQSGIKVDKSSYITANSFKYIDKYYIPSCIAYIVLKKIRLSDDGDHIGLLAEVTGYKYLNEDGDILTTDLIYK